MHQNLILSRENQVNPGKFPWDKLISLCGPFNDKSIFNPGKLGQCKSVSSPSCGKLITKSTCGPYKSNAP